MRLASRVIIRLKWTKHLRRKHTAGFAAWGLPPETQTSFQKLQIEANEEPYVRRPEPNPAANEVAILGGGITGLATAFELANLLPDGHITLYEQAERLGGWLDSEIVSTGSGEAVFEWGPRTLRATRNGAGDSIIRLLASLGMGPDIVATSVNAPASRSRFIYFPDHLVRLPGPLPGASVLTNIIRNSMNICTETLFNGSVSALFREPAVEPRPPNLEDQSVGDFITRRFGRPVADNLASAIFHGIYAGDLYKLSARTLLPPLWHLENKDSGIVGAMGQIIYNGQSLVPWNRLRTLTRLSAHSIPGKGLEDVANALSCSSVYTFKRGLHELVGRLEDRLRSARNVTIETSSTIRNLSYQDEPKPIKLSKASSPGPEVVRSYDYLISTIAPTSLAACLPHKHRTSDQNSLFGALTTPTLLSVNVMVVNLFYSNPHLISHRGFGYLIPRSIPLSENPERALGVIFGSETSVGQDTATGTKLTVMLGGHWWSDWDAPTEIPDQNTSIHLAKSVLARHLGIVESPVIAKAKLAQNAIPQYPVGYFKQMNTLHDALFTTFHGRLKVAGPHTQGGVGVNDCVSKATELAMCVYDGLDGETGVKEFGQEMKWLLLGRDGIVVKEELE